MKEEGKTVEVELYSSRNEYYINLVCSVLEDNNIPFIKKSESLGSYKRIYVGKSNYRKMIFVSKEDYDKSLELITDILPNKENTLDQKTLEQQIEENGGKKYIIMDKIIRYIILAMVLILIISLIIQAIFEIFS